MQREIRDDELALVYSPGKGLRLELPTDQMPIALDGALLAGIYVRLTKDEDWAEELKHWVKSQLPGMPIH